MSSEPDNAYDTLIQFLYRAPVALIQLQQSGEIEMLNPMASQLLMPLARDGALDNLFQVLLPYVPDLQQLCAAFPGEQGVVCEGKRVLLQPAAGQVLQGPAVLSLGLLKVDGKRLMAVLLDATHEVMREQRTLASRLASAARLDLLTQLPNRAGALDLLRSLARRARLPEGDHGAVLAINLDRFKQINATFGNHVGDQVMVLVAERLRATVRASGRAGGLATAVETAVRVGGDEFAVLLDALPDRAAAERIGVRLLGSLSKPYRVGEHELACTFSIGIVLHEAGEHDAEGLLRDAAIAVGVAKAQGGGRCALFQRSMREDAMRRGGMEADLRNAVERGELFAVYQPVVGLRQDGTVDRSAGVEALVRWRHPLRGVVGPVEFIGIAEDCGLIGAIGEQVLAMACADFMRWQQRLGGRAPRLMAVNLSRAQLGQAGLCERVAAIVGASGMAPAQLQLEITESLAAQGEEMRAQLLGLKALGYQLALDDFGTGYSSLSSLHLLPVDTVKIDRSFITLAATSKHHEVLIEATVKVARSLGMKTVAEGIETPQQAAVVVAQGCDKGQGYLYSKPVSAAAIEEWLGGQDGATRQ